MNIQLNNVESEKVEQGNKILQVKDLNLYNSDFHALKNLNLDIED